jgi:hypothetical protein
VSCILLLPGGDLLLGCKAGEVALLGEDIRDLIRQQYPFSLE